MAELIPIALNNGMSHVYLVKGKKNMLIDTGVASDADNILKKMVENGICLRALSYIVLTHNHPDHSGGLAIIKKITNAHLIMHKTEVELLTRGETEKATPNGLIMSVLSKFMGSSKVSPVKAEILVEGEYSLAPLGLEAKIVHTPGHTRGSVAVALSSGDVIIGDTFNARNQKVEWPYFFNDRKQILESIGKLSRLENARVFHSSHGKTCGKDALLEFLAKQK